MCWYFQLFVEHFIEQKSSLSTTIFDDNFIEQNTYGKTISYWLI